VWLAGPARLAPSAPRQMPRHPTRPPSPPRRAAEECSAA
jgi:hypothetical protein